MIPMPLPAESTGSPASGLVVDAIATVPMMTDAIPLTVHLPVDARGAALGILATVVLIVALDWAQPFLVTLLLGILFAYTLNPLVAWPERIRIPRVVGTSMVMLVVICALGFARMRCAGRCKESSRSCP